MPFLAKKKAKKKGKGKQKKQEKKKQQQQKQQSRNKSKKKEKQAEGEVGPRPLAEWPWALPYSCIKQTQRPRDLREGRPPLFPGPPGWIHDPAKFANRLNAMGLRDQNKGGTLYVNPKQASYVADLFMETRIERRRFIALNSLYQLPEGAKATEKIADLPLRVHQQRFAVAGLFLDIVDESEAENIMSLPSALDKYGWGLTKEPGFVESIFALPRCLKCKNEPTRADFPECACGEFYCSVKCHRMDWASHNKSGDCDRIAKLGRGLVFQLTKQWWRIQFANHRKGICISPTIKQEDEKTNTYSSSGAAEGSTDFAYLWQVKYQEEYQAQGKDELDFYLEMAQPESLDPFRANEAHAWQLIAKYGPYHGELESLQQCFQNDMLSQFEEMLAVKEADSFARVVFKIHMFEVYLNLARRRLGSKHIFVRHVVDKIDYVLDRFVVLFNERVWPAGRVSKPTELKESVAKICQMSATERKSERNRAQAKEDADWARHDALNKQEILSHMCEHCQCMQRAVWDNASK